MLAIAFKLYHSIKLYDDFYILLNYRNKKHLKMKESRSDLYDKSMKSMEGSAYRQNLFEEMINKNSKVSFDEGD